MSPCVAPILLHFDVEVYSFLTGPERVFMRNEFSSHPQHLSLQHYLHAASRAPVFGGNVLGTLNCARIWTSQHMLDS